MADINECPSLAKVSRLADRSLSFVCQREYVRFEECPLLPEGTEVNMKLSLVVSLALCAALPAVADDGAYDNELREWRDTREKRLRADNGWLTLAGRFPLKSGPNTFGTGKDNDVVFPPELKGVGPDRLGTLLVDAEAKKVTLQVADGVTMQSGDKPFTGEARLPPITATGWAWAASACTSSCEGRYILRLADNESAVRKKFKGCVGIRPTRSTRSKRRSCPIQPTRRSASSISSTKSRTSPVPVLRSSN